MKVNPRLDFQLPSDMHLWGYTADSDDLRRWERMYQGGNMWAAWDCYLTASRDILGLKLPQHKAYEHWEQAAIHGGFRLMHEEFCMVSDFPAAIHKDEQNRPHCATGPSHLWRDGWALYRWHGVEVPREWIEGRDTLDPKVVLAEQNAEKRRAGMEIIGWKRALDQLGATVVDEDVDPRIGKLLRCDMPDAPASQFLMATCATGRLFALPVLREHRTAAEANAWGFDITVEDLRAMQART